MQTLRQYFRDDLGLVQAHCRVLARAMQEPQGSLAFVSQELAALKERALPGGGGGGGSEWPDMEDLLLVQSLGTLTSDDRVSDALLVDLVYTQLFVL